MSRCRDALLDMARKKDAQWVRGSAASGTSFARRVRQRGPVLGRFRGAELTPGAFRPAGLIGRRVGHVPFASGKRAGHAATAACGPGSSDRRNISFA
jgi:hypothetical protein